MAKNKQKHHSKTAKTTRKRKGILTPKNIAWIIAFIILIAVAVVIVLRLFASPINRSDTSSESDDSQSSSEATADQETTTSNAMDNSDVTNSTSTSTSTDTSTSSTTVENKTPTKYEGADANTFEKLTGSITYNAVVDNVYKVRVSIDQLLEGAGTCVLTLKSGSQEFTRTSSTIDNPSSSTCEGFDIPVAQLKSGDYTVSIEVLTSSRSTTLTGAITIP